MKISKSALSIIFVLALIVVAAVVILIWNKENATPLISITPNVELTPTSSTGEQPTAQLLEEINFPSKGSIRLEIGQSDVAIGIAEGFQDVTENSKAPFTIFVIYGPVNTDIVLLNGSWKVWGNASESFLQSQIDAQVAALKENRSNEFDARGYRVIECHEQVESCTTLQSFP